MQTVNFNAIEKLDFRTKESYKTLRTNLEFSGRDRKVISVTSCTPNEGKTSVSFQLALSIAEGGKRVVLVDADLRKSVLKGRYKTNASRYGLSHYLSGQASIADVTCKTNIENFYVIFSGPVPPNPSELLGNDAFRLLLEYLRNEYDYVIVDTPPLGSVIDGAVAAQYCDGTVVVIESGAISYKFAQKVKEQLEKFGVPVLTDHSSYEKNPLGRTEWVKLYGLLTGHEKEAEEAFAAENEAFASIGEEEETGKTVAFFYITTNGEVNVRKSADYLPKMIELAGGKYIFDKLGDEDDVASTMSM